MLSYGRLTVNFRIGVFTHARWLFSYGTALFPDARGHAKTYTDDNFRIIGQARSSFHLSVLESVYIKT